MPGTVQHWQCQREPPVTAVGVDPRDVQVDLVDGRVVGYQRRRVPVRTETQVHDVEDNGAGPSRPPALLA